VWQQTIALGRSRRDALLHGLDHPYTQSPQNKVSASIPSNSESTQQVLLIQKPLGILAIRPERNGSKEGVRAHWGIGRRAPEDRDFLAFCILENQRCDSID